MQISRAGQLSVHKSQIFENSDNKQQNVEVVNVQK